MVFEEFELVIGIYFRVGCVEVGGDFEFVNVIVIIIIFKFFGQWFGDYDYEGLQLVMFDVVVDWLLGLVNNFFQLIQLCIDELLFGIKVQIVISIFGENFGEFVCIGEQVKCIV